MTKHELKCTLGSPRRLDECPIGLFMCMGELCLKTEYREPNGAVSAFIVGSGEFFWGPSPQSVASQNAETVTPLSLDEDEPSGSEADPLDTLVELLAPVLTQSKGMAAREREDRFRRAMTDLCNP